MKIIRSGYGSSVRVFTSAACTTDVFLKKYIHGNVTPIGSKFSAMYSHNMYPRGLFDRNLKHCFKSIAKDHKNSHFLALIKKIKNPNSAKRAPRPRRYPWGTDTLRKEKLQVDI